MTDHLTLFLARFLVNFSRFYIQNIKAIAYDFGTFVMFSIFESVILFFLKQSNIRVYVIHEEIIQIGRAKHLETLGR